MVFTHRSARQCGSFIIAFIPPLRVPLYIGPSHIFIRIYGWSCWIICALCGTLWLPQKWEANRVNVGLWWRRYTRILSGLFLNRQNESRFECVCYSGFVYIVFPALGRWPHCFTAVNLVLLPKRAGCCEVEAHLGVKRLMFNMAMDIVCHVSLKALLD